MHLVPFTVRCANRERGAHTLLDQLHGSAVGEGYLLDRLHHRCTLEDQQGAAAGHQPQITEPPVEGGLKLGEGVDFAGDYVAQLGRCVHDSDGNEV